VDFNSLYHRQQVSLMRADLASCGLSRAAHEGLAQLYARVIERRKAEGAAVRQSEVLIQNERDIITASGV
jgi:hypothetical protein